MWYGCQRNNSPFETKWKKNLPSYVHRSKPRCLCTDLTDQKQRLMYMDQNNTKTKQNKSNNLYAWNKNNKGNGWCAYTKNKPKAKIYVCGPTQINSNYLDALTKNKLKSTNLLYGIKPWWRQITIQSLMSFWIVKIIKERW